MAQISIDSAAERTGVRRETLEEWATRGLLTIHAIPSATEPADRVVDEEELEHVIESLGWLNLSAQTWEGPEDEG